MEFSVATAEEFDATGVDVVVSNAVLQWVPTHRDLLRRWAAQLSPARGLAFQVPELRRPLARLMRELAVLPAVAAPPRRSPAGTESVAAPGEYLDLLAGADCSPRVADRVLHVLPGEDPVLEWVRGHGVRPVCRRWTLASAAEFEREYAALLREPYPARDYGTPFPFRRTFAVSTLPG